MPDYLRHHQNLAEFIGRVRNGESLSRREIAYWSTRLGGSLAAAALLAACGSNAKSTTTSAASGSGATAAGTASSSSPAATATSAPVGTGEKGKVLVRTPGGAYEDAWRKASWEPFAKETGIQVVPVATNAAKVLAMVQAQTVELDVLDLGEFQTIGLQKLNALEKLDQSKFTRTSLSDVDPVNDYYLGNNVFSTVIGYNTESFKDKHPASWADVWDTSAFPGPRMLEDMAAGEVDLEAALLADGVSMDKIYPIDVDRAFKSLGKIKKNVAKFWDSGAVSAQMLADKNAVLGSVWNGRIQTLMDKGAPLAIEWNQSMRLLQAFAIVKGAPNLANAHQLIDYSLQPAVQAEFAKVIGYGPVNKKAFDTIDQATAAKLPTSPDHLKISFANDAEWWVANAKSVTERWQEFLLS